MPLFSCLVRERSLFIHYGQQGGEATSPQRPQVLKPVAHP
jgi:hypothetical protein